MIDNEPANLKAVFELDDCKDILPLHAHTLFETECGELPHCSASGSDYELSDVATENTLPQDVQESRTVGLSKFDEAPGTTFFDNLEFTDSTVHENHVGELLRRLDIPAEDQKRVLDFWLENRWRPGSLIESHRAFEGAMEIIRWFQMQPNVVVGLNTGRPEHLRRY